MALPSGLSQISDISKLLNGFTQSFQAPTLVAAPYTTITDLSGNARTLPDPANTLRSYFGTERIIARTLELVINEKGSAGEPVWKIPGEERVRFIGPNWRAYFGNAGTSPAVIVTGSTAESIEVTFYGTGLGFYNSQHSGALNWTYSVDGGPDSTNFNVSAGNTVLAARQYNAQIVQPLVTGLTLGTHTVRIKKNDTISGFICQGFEIYGPSSMVVTPGSLFSKGRMASVGTQTALTYNSFNSGTSNGRGGCATVYEDGAGGLGIAFNPTNATSQFLSAADHTNESAMKYINYREFGAYRGDDMSLITTSSSARQFNMDDGQTSVGGVGVITANSGGDSVRASGGGNSVYFTFVGTGFDIKTTANDANTRDTVINIDGVNVGTLTITSSAPAQTIKIASGLPYGTHTVRLVQSGSFDTAFIQTVVIYAPKKPALPLNAVEISNYFLTANYSVNAASIGTGIGPNLAVNSGVVSFAPHRNFQYVGTGWSVQASDTQYLNLHGSPLSTANQNEYVEYTFFGTGVEAQFGTSNGGTYTVGIQIDGTSNATGTVYGNVTNGGGGSYSTNGTGIQNYCKVVFTGLTLGYHKIRVTKTSATNSAFFNFQGFNVITPVHHQGRFTSATGQYIVSYMRPFKDPNYLAFGSSSQLSVLRVGATPDVSVFRRPHQIFLSNSDFVPNYSDPNSVSLTCVGELEDEVR